MSTSTPIDLPVPSPSHPSNTTPTSPSETTSPLPSPSTKRGFLSKLHPKQLKKIPRVAAGAAKAAPLPFRGGKERREALFRPLKDGDKPLGTMVVRVLAGRELQAKDKNGLSDPYVVIRYGNARVTSPTVPKSLNPVWGIIDPSSSSTVGGAAGEARLGFPLYDSLAFGRERVEIVCWDKDRVGSEYLGELGLGLADWWGDSKKWKEGRPPVGFADEENEPIWHTLRSSRSRATVSGELLVQIGFLPNDASSSSAKISDEQRAMICAALGRVADEFEVTRRASREDRILLTAPTEGVGTLRLHSTAYPSGQADPPDPDLSSSSSSDEDDSSTSGEDSDTEEDGDDASTSADEDDLATAVEAPTDYFDFPASSAASSPSRTAGHPPTSIPAVAVSPETPLASTFAEAEVRGEGETAHSSTAPPPVPAIVVDPSAPKPSSASPQPPPSIKRGFSLPGFMKRRLSAQSLSTQSAAGTGTGTGTMTPLLTPNTSSGGGGESDLTGTDLEVSSASASAAEEGGKQPRRRRFARRRNTKQERDNSGDIAVGMDDQLVEMSLVAGGVGISPAVSASGKVKKTRRRKNKKSLAEDEVDGRTEDGEGKKRRQRRKQKSSKRHHHGFTYEDDDGGIAGLVQIEIVGAQGLPRFKNALRTSYDMDPFCVISFGRKIFRTRVIRHSLNPVWEERLWFHVGEAETHWTIGFTVSDWDKISGNDHVGDVTVKLDQLLGSSIQPNERGLYPAGPDGKLVGDDFHDHDIPLVLSAADKDVGDARPTLQIRAKYTPYASLRQQFWRMYARQYDIDENGTLSHVELFSMLDSLGSTLTRDTITSFFTRFNKTTDDELTVEEVVLCLEEEVKKPNAEKRTVGAGAGTEESGTETPSIGGPAGGPSAGDFTEQKHEEPGELDQTDQSSNMKTLAPGTEVLTNQEDGTIVQAGTPQGRVRTPSGSNSMEPSSDEGSGKSLERVINIKECPLCRKPRLSGRGEASIVTHLGICASTDPNKVNRVLVTNYVTADQAQRKFLNKVWSKVMKGSYNLGADSANIIVQDRQTGTLQEEKMAVYVRLGIRLMYKGMSGNMEGARIRRLLDSLTKKQGAKYDSTASAREIEPFIKFHNLNMEEVLDPLSSFKTFNQFFYRKLKPEARPVADPDDPRTVVSCADCRAMFFQTISDATSIWIKGREFSIARMFGDYYGPRASEYDGGSLAIFRLAPQDYHRYHSPVDGIMGRQEYISGQYYTVNPMAIRSAISVYTENVRLVAPIESPVFGEVMNVWVGAMMVASIEMTEKEGEETKRGDETGYFAFGGSTIVVVFKPNTVHFDDDLLRNSKHSVETLVRVGTRIGRAVEKA